MPQPCITLASGHKPQIRQCSAKNLRASRRAVSAGMSRIGMMFEGPAYPSNSRRKPTPRFLHHLAPSGSRFRACSIRSIFNSSDRQTRDAVGVTPCPCSCGCSIAGILPTLPARPEELCAPFVNHVQVDARFVMTTPTNRGDAYSVIHRLLKTAGRSPSSFALLGAGYRRPPPGDRLYLHSAGSA